MEVKVRFSQTLTYNSLLYSSVIHSIVISKPNIFIRTLKGKHKSGYDDGNVQVLNFRNSTIIYFPRGLNNFYPQLQYLNVSNCGLKSLSREDLVGLENLVSFNASRNQLRMLPSDLFENFKKLNRIDFSYNKLQFISSQLIESLIPNKMVQVDFRCNPKIDVCLGKFNWRITRQVTMQEMMDLIDDHCCMHDEKFEDETFSETARSVLDQMWASGAFSDFTIVAEGPREFPVHKSVLYSQSSVFAAVFNNDKMEEMRTGRMIIENFSADAIEQFLGFFYTGKIPNEIHAMELFALASKYDVPELKIRSEAIIIRNTDESNAIEVFSLAYLHSAPKMEKKAFEEIKEKIAKEQLEDYWMNQPNNLDNFVKRVRNRNRQIQEAKSILEKAVLEIYEYLIQTILRFLTKANTEVERNHLDRRIYRSYRSSRQTSSILELLRDHEGYE